MQQTCTLLGLYTNTRSRPNRITDRRLMYNGFDLVKYEQHDNSGGDGVRVTVTLEGKDPNIPFLGLADLKEILDKIRLLLH